MAALDAFEVRWTNQILHELTRNALADHPDIDPERLATHTIAAIDPTSVGFLPLRRSVRTCPHPAVLRAAFGEGRATDGLQLRALGFPAGDRTAGDRTAASVVAVAVRRPDLTRYPGRYVALDLETDAVLADAATLPELATIIRARGLRASIVRAPREDEPVLVGLG